MKVDSLPANWASFKLSEIAAGAGQSVTPKDHPQETFDLFSVPAFENRVPDQPLGEEIKSNKQSVEPGNVLLCKIVPHLNRVWTVPEKATNRQIASGEWVRYDTAGLDPEYVRLALSSPEFRDEFMTTISGVGGSLTRARPQMFNQFDIPLPPLAEQRRIVEKLDQLSARTRAAKDHLTHVQTLATRAKQATLAAAFRGDLSSKTLNTEDWEQVAFCELISDGPTNGWSPKADGDINGTRTLKLSATTSGELDLSEGCVKYLSVRPDEHSKFWLRPGDLLIQRANSLQYLGASAIFEGPVATYIYPDLMMRVRVRDEAMRKYLWRFLNSPEARSYFRDNATGTAGNMPKISGKLLKALVVPVPKSRCVTEIVRRIEAAFARIDRMVAEATRAADFLQRLEAQLLAKAFQGELVPQDPNDEPASALLARIREARANAPQPKRARKKKAAS
ncbi:restriction endonuclease subunit S [Leisingera sp. S232]|uniref:restriction endonuclease subunit S n=1 Tax=Leisingera sp. S232 TaxID=3415132 RepID=UPI003C7DD182